MGPMKRLAIGAIGILAPLSACSSAYVDGTFDGVSFKPDKTQMAVIDRYPERSQGVADIRTPKAAGAQSLTLLFSGARFDARADWSRQDAATRSALAQAWALHDGLVLERIPLDRVKTGEVIELAMDLTGRVGDGDFAAWWIQALPDDAQIAEQGIGAKSEVQIRFDRVEMETGGLLEGRVELKRSRAETQASGEVATGEVVLHFSVALMPEALGEANLALALPIFRCAAALGPTRAGACASRKVHDAWREGTPVPVDHEDGDAPPNSD